MSSVILNSPFLLLLVLAAIGFSVWDRKVKSGFAVPLLSALFGGAALVCAFFSGASLQEITILALALLLPLLRAFGRGQAD